MAKVFEIIVVAFFYLLILASIAILWAPCIFAESVTATYLLAIMGCTIIVLFSVFLIHCGRKEQ